MYHNRIYPNKIYSYSLDRILTKSVNGWDDEKEGSGSVYRYDDPMDAE